VLIASCTREECSVQLYERAWEWHRSTLLCCPVMTRLSSVPSTGDPEGGIRLYERALAFNPRYPDALYNLGVACGEAGLSDRAVFAYEMAAQLNPSCAEVRQHCLGSEASSWYGVVCACAVTVSAVGGSASNSCLDAGCICCCWTAQGSRHGC
jgi:tetratricopeptide (TPR) repeat protein